MEDFLSGVTAERAQAEEQRAFTQAILKDLQFHQKLLVIEEHSLDIRERMIRKALRQLGEDKRQNSQAMAKNMGDRLRIHCNLKKEEHQIGFLKGLEILKGPLEFGKFPPEIRKTILELVILEIDGDSGDIDISTSPARPPNRIRGLALLRTSKEMREESACIFYGQRKFLWSGGYTLDLRTFLSKAAPYVRHLTLEIGFNSSIVEVLHQLEACYELRTARMLVKTLPLFRGGYEYAPESLKGLKFKRPAHLEAIVDPNVDGGIKTLVGGKVLEACKILQTILQDGSITILPSRRRGSGLRLL